MNVKIKFKQTPVLPIVLVYLVNGNVIQLRRGVLTPEGKLLLLKKTLLGWRRTGEEYIVKPEHFTLIEKWVGVFRRHQVYLLSVYVDPREKKSLPPPKSDSPPWRPEELEIARKTITNILIVRAFEEERKQLQRLMSRMQWIMLGMFISSLIFIGILYYYSSNTLVQQLKEVIKELFPAPTPGGG